MKYLVYFFTLILLTSCSHQDENRMMESPLAVVIKLESAESIRDFETAKNYIEVEKVYSEIAKKENKSSYEIWKQFVEFNYSIGNSSSKFTNCLPFHKYRISETIKDQEAIVKFQGLVGDNQRIKMVIYRLQLIDNSWKVVSIDYKK